MHVQSYVDIISSRLLLPRVCYYVSAVNDIVPALFRKIELLNVRWIGLPIRQLSQSKGFAGYNLPSRYVSPQDLEKKEKVNRPFGSIIWLLIHIPFKTPVYPPPLQQLTEWSTG